MSEKYRVGIEFKSVDYYTLEVELVECNDIESVLPSWYEIKKGVVRDFKKSK